MTDREKEALENITNQLKNGYIDISDMYPDEFEFNIIKEAIDLYKKKEELEKQSKIINLMAENIYKNIDMLQMLDIAKETNYDLEKVFNGLEDEKVLSIIKQYFEKKIEEDK